MPTNPTQPPDSSLDEPWERMLKLRKPIEEAMNRNDWTRACELFVENIRLAEQMLDFAGRYGSQADIRNCVRRVELYRETYSQLITEVNHTAPSSFVLPRELEPEEREVTKSGQSEFARLLTCVLQLVAFCFRTIKFWSGCLTRNGRHRVEVLRRWNREAW
jgi:hypothetical protein